MAKAMKKIISVMAVVCLLAVFMAACSASKGPSVDKVKKAFEDEGYTVTSSTISGVSALVGVKSTDTITVLFCASKDDADKLVSTYETAATALGQTCKQDKNNIYYGTTAAIAIYGKI